MVRLGRSEGAVHNTNTVRTFTDTVSTEQPPQWGEKSIIYTREFAQKANINVSYKYDFGLKRLVDQQPVDIKKARQLK